MRKSLLVTLLFFPFLTSAQRYYGIATSNWSGTNGIFLNPASVADSRHRFTIDLFSVNAGLDNDKASFKLSNLVGGNVSNADSLLTFKSDTKTFNLTAPYAELRGPGFMWSIDKKSGVALTTRIRVFNQFQEFDRKLYGAMISEDYRSNVGDFAIDDGKFNWNLHAWTEIGGTYGRVLLDNGRHMLKGGVTARYLVGSTYINLKGNYLRGRYIAQNDSIRIDAADASLSSNAISNENDLTRHIFNEISGNEIAALLVDNKSGGGFGMDLGFVYEWRPDNDSFRYEMDGVKGIDDNSVNRYRIRVSAAITDIGSIRYTKGNRTAYMKGTGGLVAGNVSFEDFHQFTTYMRNRGLSVDTSSGSTKVKLPTALLLMVDYNIGRNFYANLAFNGNLVDRFATGNVYYSQLTLTPRYDKRALSVGLPITYNLFSHKMKLGLGFRFGGFFAGSDDMLAIFGGEHSGFNFYFGAGIPINKKRPHDRDNDAVSDKKDNCKYEKGPWENKGCPILDKDGDGILDSADKCPTIPGSKTAFGCPDGDLDSVADASDACPNEAGPVSLNGCPDRDHDGIADKDDMCPDAPGTAVMHGCPDRDGDGVADNEDACPDKPGPVANKGCPDTDNDGVADNMDRCPTVPGTVANNGCPEIKEEVKKRLAFAATAIQFETGKAVIKPASYRLLDDIVKILNDYPDYSMRIEGHTDNVGKPAFNLTLSQARAASVKAYFVSKGIPASRLVTDGFGDTQPAASNKTAAGKAKNRRVEMNLFLPEGTK